MEWIAVIFTIVSGAANACMDVMKHKYSRSVFSDIDNSYFRKDGWRNSYVHDGRYLMRKEFLGLPVPKNMLDAWHGFKTTMFLSIFIAGLAWSQVFEFELFDIFVLFINWQVLRGFGFEAFYCQFLRKSPEVPVTNYFAAAVVLMFDHIIYFQ